MLSIFVGTGNGQEYWEITVQRCLVLLKDLGDCRVHRAGQLRVFCPSGPGDHVVGANRVKLDCLPANSDCSLG